MSAPIHTIQGIRVVDENPTFSYTLAAPLHAATMW